MRTAAGNYPQCRVGNVSIKYVDEINRIVNIVVSHRIYVKTNTGCKFCV